jgi:tetratricopeptide (TPR) repeat protein
LKRVSIFSSVKQILFLLVALALACAGCSLKKKSGFNRSMQNLTAHYNILFNANELLRQKQVAYATAFVDNYNEILNVYPDTTTFGTTPDKDMEAAILKANNIINIKEQSHYLGDAYLVLGKANYLSGNYFNAVEFFSYVVRSFPTRPDLTQEALVWKARALLYLKQVPQAKLVLDTAIQNINPKKRITADVYAARLQYDIDDQNYTEGEEMAKQALTGTHEKAQRLRLKFILGQLQELNAKPADAFANYTFIVKSNASFEMAFNANLNRIRIADNQNGVKTSRIDQLKALLKNQNNKEFTDQVYYQIAEMQFAGKDIDGAIKNYKLSAHSSIKNQNQKGLSYLRLAEIYFKNKADYIVAKKYYDSTLTSLSPNYPGYQSIQKKSNNLQLLADRLQIISREDTLQVLAAMDEKARAARIDLMVNRQILQQQTLNSSNTPANIVINDIRNPQASKPTGSAFYFYNSNALSQGYSDFKRKWGNRKLEDNWRRSNRSGGDQTNSAAPSPQSTDPDAQPGQLPKNANTVTAGNYRQEIIQNLPLTPALMAQSNQRIYNAYIDIGNFYRDILEDKKEAINTYELVLTRFPNDPNKPAVYYNLYRLYSEVDPAKSGEYKNRLLKEYANTPFAKVILDPDYAKKLDDENAGFTTSYNQVYDLYAQRQYKDVATRVPELLRQYPGNKFTAQLYYLQTIAAGHQEKLPPFRDSLLQIVKRFPDDKLIAPLVNQHLAYINANQAEMMTRIVVLADEDPNEIPFTLEPVLKKDAAYRPVIKQGIYMATADVRAPEKKTAPVTTPPVTQAPVKNDAVVPAVTTQQPVVTQAPAPVVVKPKFVSNLFNERDSTNYYFVVRVSVGTINLASSRFGIGQFNRANYAGNGIKHQLKNADDDNQLIYVGRFTSLNEVKDYAKGIVPLLPDIMKVPKDKYSFFIITKENLDKLADRKTLDSYIDYYQQSF